MGEPKSYDTKWPVRYRLVGLLTIGAMINFADRVNISVAAPVMMPALGWDEAKFGLIFSAFLTGYTLFQFPGGLIADRWDAKRVIAFSCLFFSLFTALTPLGAMAFGLMLAIRFLVGAFESVSFPAYASFNSRWIPRDEYSRAQTISLSGSYLGQAIAYPLTIWMVQEFSWPMVFYVNAAIGVVWMTVWLLMATNHPTEHPRISQAELKMIQEYVIPRRAAEVVSPWHALKSRSVLMLSLSYMCLVFGVWMIMLWLPTYLVKARGLTLEQMSWVGMIPTIASFIGLVSGGVLSDQLLRRGFPPHVARIKGPALCIILGVPFLVVAVLVPWSSVSVTCFAAYLCIINLATGGYWGVPLELNPKLVGAISGIMTCAGNLGGVFGPSTAGYIYRATGNWALPFLIAAVMAVVAFLIFYFLVVPESEAKKNIPMQSMTLSEPTLTE